MLAFVGNPGHLSSCVVNYSCLNQALMFDTYMHDVIYQDKPIEISASFFCYYRWLV